MTFCATCPCDEHPFTQVGSLILCARCSAALKAALTLENPFLEINDPLRTSPGAAVAADATPSHPTQRVGRVLSDPSSLTVHSTYGVAGVLVPEEHKQSATSVSEMGSTAQPVAASTASVPEASKAAAGTFDMPDIPDFLRRRKVA